MKLQQLDRPSAGRSCSRGRHGAAKPEDDEARWPPGTLWLKLVKAYPGGACTFADVQTSLDGILEYLVAHKGGTQTLFTLHPWPPRACYGASPKTFVTSVAVRTHYQAQPEFARDYAYRCRDGWKSTPLPQQR